MGFHEKSPEYQACVKFLEAIKPKQKKEEHQQIEIIDLVFPAESPRKKQNMEVLVVTNIPTKELANTEPDDKRDDLEEHQEKQQKDDQDNDGEIKQDGRLQQDGRKEKGKL